jgi:hypothetical protein
MAQDPAAAPIRVLLAGLPQMLSDILAGLLASAPDISWAEAVEPARLLDDVDTQRTHVVLCGAGLERPCRDLLWSRPRLKVVSVSVDGGAAFLHQLLPHEQPLGNLSPERLFAVIRSVADPAAAGSL